VFKRILVPLDGSSFGEAALRPATELARRTGGELRLLSVHEPDWFPTGRALSPGFQRWREEYLARVARGVPDVPSSVSVREGSAETLILEEADSWGAGLIVMSTHGRGAVSRHWLGSVADHCLRHAHVPLMLVRARPSELDAGEAPFSPARIVLPLDGTEPSERGLPLAADLAQIFGARLSLIRVVGPLAPAATAPEAWEKPQPSLEEGRQVAERYLGVEAERLRSRGRGIPVTTEVVEAPHAAQAIIDHAARDLVVMATHVGSSVRRALVGSVTDKVVRGSRGCVVAIPAAARPDAFHEGAGPSPPLGQPDVARVPTRRAG
jgi:nucleotide-binding universal stress UspA family protein